MKKIVSILLIAWMLACAIGGAVCAGAEAAPYLTVYVTVADETGNLALAAKPVTVPYVSDGESEPTVTVDKALYYAHEQYYQGGAQAGYASSEGSHGLSLNKLWGVENGGAYGYYVNHKSAMELGDTIHYGDHVAAFIYTDTASWSDTYCFFDRDVITAYAPEKVTLTLKAASWSGEPTPVVDATVTVNGVATDVKTDKNGIAALDLPVGENYIISACSDTQILVPPVCTVHVLDNTPEPHPAGTNQPEQPSGEKDAGKTAESAVLITFTGMAVALLAFGIIDLALSVHAKKRN